MKRNFICVLAFSALILTAGCKKSINSSVDLTNGAKAGFAPGAVWQNPPNVTTRIIRYDINTTSDGYANCLLTYDIGTNAVTLTQFSNGSSTSLWTSTNGITCTNGTNINMEQYNSECVDQYNEIGGVHIIPYDATGDGHDDHLLVYIPGHGIVYLIHYSGGQWIYDASYSNGIGGYDLAGANKTDKIISYDYGNGVKDYLICYRPGNGYVWIIKSNHGSGGWNFSTVQSGSGIGGFDMSDVRDQLACIGGPAQGKMNLAAYRPTLGYVWLIAHQPNSTSFGNTYNSRSGLPGFSFGYPQDRIVTIYSGGAQNVPENDATFFAYRPDAGISATYVYEWNSTISPISNSLTSFTWSFTGNTGYLLLENPYAPPATSGQNQTDGSSQESGDHVLAFAGNGLGGNDCLLFYTPGYPNASQLYYPNSTGSGYTQAY